jgi:hypothetical protein
MDTGLYSSLRGSSRQIPPHVDEIVVGKASWAARRTCSFGKEFDSMSARAVRDSGGAVSLLGSGVVAFAQLSKLERHSLRHNTLLHLNPGRGRFRALTAKQFDFASRKWRRE